MEPASAKERILLDEHEGSRHHLIGNGVDDLDRLRYETDFLIPHLDVEIVVISIRMAQYEAYCNRDGVHFGAGGGGIVRRGDELRGGYS